MRRTAVPPHPYRSLADSRRARGYADGFNPDMQRRVREYFYQSRHLQGALLTDPPVASAPTDARAVRLLYWQRLRVTRRCSR